MRGTLESKTLLSNRSPTGTTERAGHVARVHTQMRDATQVDTMATRRPHEWNLGPCGRTRNCTHANGTVFNIRIRRTRLRSSTQHPLGGDRGRLACTKPTRRGGRRSHREHCRWLSRRERRGCSIKAAIGRHSGRLTVGHGAGPPRAADRCRPWDGPPDAVFYTGPAPSPQ